MIFFGSDEGSCLNPIASICMVYIYIYIPTFTIKIKQMYSNVGEYTIYGSYGNESQLAVCFFVEDMNNYPTQ